MAVIQPTFSYPADGVTHVLWEALTESDTASPILVKGAQTAISSVQVTGTFGSGVIAMQGSNVDGGTGGYVTLQDIEGADVSLSAAGAQDFSTAMLHLKPVATTAGTGRDVDIHLVLRS